MTMYRRRFATFGILATVTATSVIAENRTEVGDDVIASHRAALAANTDGQGFGPQAPRDLTSGMSRRMLKF